MKKWRKILWSFGLLPTSQLFTGTAKSKPHDWKLPEESGEQQFREYLVWIIGASQRALDKTGYEHHAGANKAYRNALKKFDKYCGDQSRSSSIACSREE